MKRSIDDSGDEWALFGDDVPVSPEASGASNSGPGGVGGVAADEHPYFKKRIFADEPLQEALDDYVPTACDLLMMSPGGRAAAAQLLEAARAFSSQQRELCAQVAAKCAASSWQLMQQLPAGEAVIHAHALAHAMLAAVESDGQKAMLHADLSLSVCPDLPIAAVHSVMRRCNERCPAVAPAGCGPWQIPSTLPSAKRPEVRKAMKRLACSQLSVAAFRDDFLKAQQPGVIEGHLDAAGWSTERTVPVEMGFRENDEQSAALQLSDSQGSMLLSDFVSGFLLPSNAALNGNPTGNRRDEAIDEWSASKVAYMAQHQLLLQIPELRKDILVPHYCALGELQTVNVWIGTAGTVTALHYDLDDNFLVQVAGYKYLRLYSPGEGERLYAKDAPRDRQKKHGASYSPVRVECPDLQAHPNFEKASYVETILGPGEMLFIPKRWWHYVRSLTTSISVNFWF